MPASPTLKYGCAARLVYLTLPTLARQRRRRTLPRAWPGKRERRQGWRRRVRSRRASTQERTLVALVVVPVAVGQQSLLHPLTPPPRSSLAAGCCCCGGGA